MLAGLLLAIATVNDVVRQTHINHRLIADLRTWRSYTGHDYHNLSTEQDSSATPTRDVVCGNTTPGPPKERIAALPGDRRDRSSTDAAQCTAAGTCRRRPKTCRHSATAASVRPRAPGLCGPAAAGAEGSEGTVAETGQ